MSYAADVWLANELAKIVNEVDTPSYASKINYIYNNSTSIKVNKDTGKYYLDCNFTVYFVNRLNIQKMYFAFSIYPPLTNYGNADAKNCPAIDYDSIPDGAYDGIPYEIFQMTHPFAVVSADAPTKTTYAFANSVSINGPYPCPVKDTDRDSNWLFLTVILEDADGNLTVYPNSTLIFFMQVYD